MTSMFIEDAISADIPALTNLLAELFSIEKDFQPDTARQIRGLQLVISNPQQAVIKVAKTPAGAIIGMVSAQLVFSTAQGAASAWVEDMVISQQYRGNGVGKALLQAALDWAKDKGATRAQLLVDMENEAAIGYYRHLGWETTQLQARRIFL
ncbi:MAG: GNAT family N-acetyltransferase [Nitrosomonadales bacterium]|nr:GNAT family N-acetyltransferase [Nitrosomonadales bacterium]